MEADITLTEAAVDKVRELMEEEQNPAIKLRVYITGGGCSGFQYGFTFDEKMNVDDWILEKKGVTLLIDVMSVQYLMGATIDYKSDINGERFIIQNPQAKTTCGCGSSFSV